MASPKAEYRGEISFTHKMKTARPSGGVPVTGMMIKTDDPDDPALKDFRDADAVTVQVYEIATGKMVSNGHTKLHAARQMLRNMKAGTWVRYPKVTRRDHLLAPTLSQGGGVPQGETK